MTKSRRMIEEDIKLVDLVIELLDARIPSSSRNPDIDRIGSGKARFVILNKSDMADEKATREWVEYFSEEGLVCTSLDSRDNNAAKKLLPLIMEACREKIERNKRRGIKNRPVRAMVAGIPNVGKSTFINSFAGKKIAKTGNKPGVTRGKQWIRLSKEVELLDTPGILWPKFDDPAVGERLAMTGAIKEDIINIYDTALKILDLPDLRRSGILNERYGAESDAGNEAILEGIALSRGYLLKGGVPDTDKAAKTVCDEFKNGKLGRISLERPVV